MTSTSDQTSTEGTDAGAAITPAAGRPPVAAPAAGYLGTLLALLLLAVGVVALRDVAVDAGWLRGSPWITNVIDGLDGVTYQGWMLPVGIVVAVLGLWLMTFALRPRRRTGLAVPAHSSVWIGPADVARLAAGATDSVPGVLDSQASATLRTITVKADVTAAGDPGIKAAIVTAVGDAVHGYTTKNPRIKVRTRTGDH